MEDFSIVGAENLFVSALDQQSSLDSLSSQALSKGIDYYQKKEYEKAAQEFEKSINLSPNSSFTSDTTKYLSQAYLQLDNPDKAIDTYERGIELNRDGDDLRSALGNLFYAEERYDEAVVQYREAVRINPASSSNHYSLGQGLIKADKLDQAENEFRTVLRLEPYSPHGNFGLGQTFAKLGDFDDAIEQFEAVLKKQPDYYDAYAEMGYVYADKGEIKAADEIAEFLEDTDEDLAETLRLYINKVEPPKIMFSWGSATFRSKMPMNTPLSALDSYLETPGASKSFTMKFQFNKDMDRSSIENPLNWSISRARSGNLAKTYNFGNAVADTEIAPPAFPDYVIYDAQTFSATIGFTLTQNDAGDGSIDPQHIVFKFNGKDTEGMKIDPDYDEYTGFSGVA
jgi:Tfp pilus assembly protein PilF